MWGCGFGRRSLVGIHFCDSIHWVDLVNKLGLGLFEMGFRGEGRKFLVVVEAGKGTGGSD